MQILNSGSFISLENELKIEQLKFTAGELAKATLESPGFVNNELKNKTLGLELWNGLEYMCRDHEESAIKNIFLNYFLERLLEVTLPITPIMPVSEIEPEENPEENQEENQDEFLGHLENAAETTNPIEEMEFESVVEDENAEDQTHIAETSTEKFSDVELSKEDIEIVTSSEGLCGDYELESEEHEDSSYDNAIKLPEKEPYQFSKCTVMVAMQLLPVSDNEQYRRAVLSVKTHDFPPQISLVQISVDNLDSELSTQLTQELARYKNDLPLKVIDKMRLEKNGAKKKTVPVATTTQVAKTTPTTTNQNSQLGVNQPETSQQGSLFG
jgi:hypothetical protein